MAEAKGKPTSTKKGRKAAASAVAVGDDIDSLKSDVASFASSLGFLGAAAASSGFDDSDFRKSGPIIPPKTSKSAQTTDAPPNPKPTTTTTKKPHPLDIHGTNATTKSVSGAVTTNYPLMKATALSGQWYADAGELEASVLGARKQVLPSVGLQEMQRISEGKRQLAEKLMAQYTVEYDMVKRGSGDLKLLEISAKSGTSADKVSAFTCLIEDNPIANMRALDSLLGEFQYSKCY
jgi:ribosome biogenesis protein MAK21